ncbi:hypothetical protein ACHAPO_006828 [Fusarium lateritium]
MKASIILSTSVFASTAVARLYKRDEIVARADMSSSTSAAPIAASPTGTGEDGAEETLSTDTGAPSTAGTATSSTSARPSIPNTYDCVSECNSNYDTCRTAPGANMSTCAAQYAGCLGYNPFEGGSLVTPTACSAPASDTPKPTQSGTSDCVTGCNDDYNKCRTAPGANMSTCAAQYAGCLGYNPFEGGSLVTPTACSVSASDTPKPTQSGTSDCLTGCNDDYNKCRTAPGANMSTCAAQYAGCLGYNPFEGGSLVTPTACSEKPQPTQSNTNECVDKCNSDYDKCRTAPNANMSTCAAQYSQCLGYNPFDGGSLVTPTACSNAPGPTQSNANECVDECNSDYDKCRTAPDANMSTCAAQYSQCLGYNPFDGAGSLVTPTACSNAPGPTLTGTSAVQSSMVSPSPPQQDTTMQGTENYQPPIATCTSDMCIQPTMTDHEAPPVATESHVVVDGAGSLRPWMTLMALAALAIL